MHLRELLERGSMGRRGQDGRLQTKITVRWTRTVMRDLLEISDACGLSLTSASSAFFNAGSFSPVLQRLLVSCLIPLRDDRVSSQPPPRRSLSLSRRVAPRRTLLANQIGPGPLSPPTAGVFRLLIIDRLHSRSITKTQRRHGEISLSDSQPSTVSLLSVSFSLVFFSCLSSVCLTLFFH